MSNSIVPLNLPKAKLSLKRIGDTIYVHCLVRKKAIVLTPEEWVRQHMINFLVEHHQISLAKIAVEYIVEYNGMQRRCDIVVLNEFANPIIIIECKAPDVQLSSDVFHQIAAYNSKLQVHKLMLSNGINHINCMINSKGEFVEMKDFNEFFKT